MALNVISDITMRKEYPQELRTEGNTVALSAVWETWQTAA